MIKNYRMLLWKIAAACAALCGTTAFVTTHAIPWTITVTIVSLLCGRAATSSVLWFLTVHIPEKSIIMWDAQIVAHFERKCHLWRPWIRKNYGYDVHRCVDCLIYSYAKRTVSFRATAGQGLVLLLHIDRVEQPEAALELAGLYDRTSGKFNSFDQLCNYMCFEFLRHMSSEQSSVNELRNPLEPSEQAELRKEFVDFIERFTEHHDLGRLRPYFEVSRQTHFELFDKPSHWCGATPPIKS